MNITVTFQGIVNLDDATASYLMLELTNSPHRGDYHDDGRSSTSAMAMVLNDRFRHASSNSDVAVGIMKVDGSITGWSTLVRRGWSRGVCLGSSAWVNLYVHPRWRRYRYGSYLVEQCAAFARQCMNVETLSAQPWNGSSHRFFEKAGFETMVTYIDGVTNGLSVRKL